MNGLRLMLVTMLAGSALVVTGCGKKSEPPKPDVEHTDDDGHGHKAKDDHTGHYH